MKVLISWLLVAAAVPLGVWVGPGLGHAEAAWAVVVALGAGGLAAAIGLVCVDRRGGRLALVVAACCVLLARGIDHAAGVRAHARVGQRGVGGALRLYEAIGPSRSGPRCRVRARAVTTSGNTPPVWLSLPSEHCPVGAGRRLWVDVGRPDAGTWPGRADPVARAQIQGAELAVDARRAWATPDPEDPGWIASTRDRAFALGRGDDARALVAATVVGAREGLAPRRRDELRAAGLGHLVAVSGLHVALATWLAFGAMLRVSALLGRGVAAGIVATVAVLSTYVVLTGAPASAVRAGAMATLAALGALSGRPSHGLTLLAVACVAMLAYRPAWALDPGFQLSAAAMAAVVTAPANASVLALTWRITWAIAPISILQFSGISMWGWLGNLVAIPVVTLWVLPLGLLGLPWLGLAPSLAWTLAAAGAGVVLELAAVLSKLPRPSAATVAALALATIGWAALVQSHRDGWWRRWCPPPWVAVATALAVFAFDRGAVATTPRWLAHGGGSHPWITAFARDAHGHRIACIDHAPSSAASALRVLEAYGVTALGQVTPVDDPAGRALSRQARQAGLHLVDDACEMPSPAEVRAHIRACGALGPPRALMERTGRMRCRAPRRPSLLDFARAS